MEWNSLCRAGAGLGFPGGPAAGGGRQNHGQALAGGSAAGGGRQDHGQALAGGFHKTVFWDSLFFNSQFRYYKMYTLGP